MSKTIKIQKAILEYLEEKLEDKDLKFFEMFLPKVSGMKKKGENDSNYPFLLIRPGDTKKNGIYRQRTFEIIIGLEEENDQVAQERLFDLAEKTIEIIEKNSVVPGKFAIDPGTIDGLFKPEICGGDFWGYTITFNAEIPSVASRILLDRGN